MYNISVGGDGETNISGFETSLSSPPFSPRRCGLILVEIEIVNFRSVLTKIYQETAIDLSIDIIRL